MRDGVRTRAALAPRLGDEADAPPGCVLEGVASDVHVDAAEPLWDEEEPE